MYNANSCQYLDNFLFNTLSCTVPIRNHMNSYCNCHKKGNLTKLFCIYCKCCKTNMYLHFGELSYTKYDIKPTITLPNQYRVNSSASKECTLYETSSYPGAIDEQGLTSYRFL